MAKAKDKDQVEELCSTCKYQITGISRGRLSDVEVLICRRYPPVGGGAFPSVNPSDACGEWKEKV